MNSVLPGIFIPPVILEDKTTRIPVSIIFCKFHYPGLDPCQKIIHMGHDIMIGVFRFYNTEDFFGLFGIHHAVAEYLGDTRIGLGYQGVFRVGFHDEVVNCNSCFRFAGFIQPACHLKQRIGRREKVVIKFVTF